MAEEELRKAIGPRAPRRAFGRTRDLAANTRERHGSGELRRFGGSRRCDHLGPSGPGAREGLGHHRGSRGRGRGLPPRADVARAGVRAFVDACRRQRAMEPVPAARIHARLPTSSSVGRDLSKRLLAPIAAELGAARAWVISPDGPLAFLPFEALPLGGRAVVETRDVRYAPSLSSLAAMPAVVTTAFASRVPRRRHHQVRRVEEPGEDLPQAQAEVRAIGELFPASQSGSCSKAPPRPRRDCGSSTPPASSAAIATSTSRRTPFFPGRARVCRASCCRESEPARQRRHHHGRRVADLSPGKRPRRALRLRNGIGAAQDGEGVVGLPHALLSAGSRAVVLTLWSVPDSSAAEFMPRFYRRADVRQVPGRRPARNQARVRAVERAVVRAAPLGPMSSTGILKVMRS